MAFITTGPVRHLARHCSSIPSTSLSSRRPLSPSSSSSSFTGTPATMFHLRRLFTPSASTSSSTTSMSIGDLNGMKDIDGKTIDPSIFSGKVVFAMNVASACGYTKAGYDLLNQLTTKFSPDDFVAVAIPCNAFMFQESGSPDDIKLFAMSKADKLVITEKTDVNGKTPHPIVGLAKDKFPGRIMWNFDGRFVFDRNGQPVARFGNSAQPAEIEDAIAKLI